jgi:hypothetical protein
MKQRLLAIACLTIKAAFRFRLVVVLTALLLGVVILLPALIKHDGTARGFAQIVLTYTLASITTLLSFTTLWSACGTLARDIEECQMQVVAVKPVGRWEIWLGKWLGIVLLNALLLGLSGSAVYLLMYLKARELTPKEQTILRNEVLVARGSAKEPIPDFKPELERRFQEEVKRLSPTGPDLSLLRKRIEEQLKRREQLVPSGHARLWRLDLSRARRYVRDQPLFLRVKFHTPQTINMDEPAQAGTFLAQILVGKPETPLQRSLKPLSLSAGTFHEVQIPPNLLDEEGILWVEFRNYNDVPLLFPLEDGMEVLYREGGFALNFIRGLGIIFFWLGLFAALGLCTASRFSFPVAAFVCLGLLFVGLSSGTLATVASEGTYMGIDWDKGKAYHPTVDAILVPIFRFLLSVVNLVQDFSPIDSLSSGRSITWGQLARAFAQIILLMSGLLASLGIFLFTRRELATAQSNV